MALEKVFELSYLPDEIWTKHIFPLLNSSYHDYIFRLATVSKEWKRLLFQSITILYTNNNYPSESYLDQLTRVNTLVLVRKYGFQHNPFKKDTYFSHLHTLVICDIYIDHNTTSLFYAFPLCYCSNIKTLVYKGRISSIYNELYRFTHLTSLSILLKHHEYLNIGKVLEKMTNLVYLALHKCRGIIPLQVLQKLEYLDIESIDYEYMINIKEISQLRHLSLTKPSLDDSLYNRELLKRSPLDLSKLRNLVALRLVNIQIGPEILQNIPLLRFLITENHFFDSGITQSSQINHILVGNISTGLLKNCIAKTPFEYQLRYYGCEYIKRIDAKDDIDDLYEPFRRFFHYKEFLLY